MQNNFYNVVYKIDDLSNKYSIENLELIESYFVKNKGIEEYFIRKVAGLIDEDFDPDPWFEALYDKGYFDPKNNPKPYKTSEKSITTPYWDSLSILENIAKKNEGKINKNVEFIEKILDDIVNYKDTKDEGTKNSITDYMITKIISYLPEEKIKNEYIGFIRIILQQNQDNSFISGEIKNHLFPKFIRSKDLTLRLLDVIFDYKKVGYRYQSIMENHYFNDSLKVFKEDIFKLCGIDAADIAFEKIKEITEIEPWQFNIATIEDHPQSTFIDEFDYQLVYFVRDLFEYLESDKIKNKIEHLINEENPIFKRIAIHTINYHYLELGGIFWNLKENPLNIPRIRHELYVLFEDRFRNFSNAEYEKLISWLENHANFIRREIKDKIEDKEEAEAYEMLTWLDALKESDNPKIQQLYSHYKQLYTKPLDHPDFDIWHGKTRTLKAIKPIKLCNKSNSDIAQYLKTNNKEEQFLPDFDKQGLYKSFKLCVSDNPVKFSRNLSPFLNVSRKSQSELLFGLYRAWISGKDFEWYNVLTLIWTIINSDSFWNEYPSEGFSYHNEIISSVSDLIAERTKRDDRPLDKQLLPLTCEILTILSDNIDSKFESYSDDLATEVINSPRGRVFIAMIYFSLSYARLYKNEEENKWLNPIKSNIIKKLKNNPSIELAFILGQYLPQIFYLNTELTSQNIELIFSTDNWKYAFNGYLHNSKIYENLYMILKTKGYYDKAMRTDFNNIDVNNNLVHHICIAYLFDKEKFDEEHSLIKNLINNKNVNQIKEIFRFFEIQDENQEIAKNKIIEIMPVIFPIIFHDPEYYKEAIAVIPRLLLSYNELNVIKQDDDIFKYFVKSIKYISKHDFFMMKYLTSFVDKSPEMTAEVFVQMINNEKTPEYGYEDDIETIIQIFYENNLKSEANKICNFYGENGYYFLRKLYFKYNKF